MRVTEVETFIVWTGVNSWVFVRVRTDEGLHGWGECTLEGKELTVRGAIEECSRTLIGADPLAIERIWNHWFRLSAWKGAALFTAMSGLEQALWDIAGKAYGVPVHRLFGGPVRDRVPVYSWPMPIPGQATPTDPHDPGVLAEQLAYVAERYGLRAVKFSPFRSMFEFPREEARRVEALMRAARDALGPDIEIAVEGHQRFLPPAAIAAASVLEPFRPLFFEEPVSSDNHEALARVRAATRIPLATGERVFTRWAAWPLVRDRLVDYLQPDVCHAGGIAETRRIAALAEPAGIAVVPHNPNGPVSLAATVQLGACTPNFLLMETSPYLDHVREGLAREPLLVRDGAIEVPASPGLGVELDEDSLRSFAGEPRELDFGPSFRSVP